MPFPLSWSGSIVIPVDAAVLGIEAALDHVAAALEREKASEVERVGNSVSFRAGLIRFVARNNVLSATDRGTIRVDQAPEGLRVEYELRFVHLLVAATVMAGGIAALVSQRGQADALLPALFAWAWLFGGNFMISIVRFPRFVRRAIEKGRS